MMECPNCGCIQSNVINSRPVESNVFRIRICKNCKSNFYTEEIVIEQDEADAYMAELKRIQRKGAKQWK